MPQLIMYKVTSNILLLVDVTTGEFHFDEILCAIAGQRRVTFAFSATVLFKIIS